MLMIKIIKKDKHRLDSRRSSDYSEHINQTEFPTMTTLCKEKMESHNERKGRYLYKTRESAERYNNTSEEKMAELIKTKEELKRARDGAMQSWLDSRPLIDELEKLQSELASAQNRSSMSNIVISELESQLETINTSIRSKREEELNTTEMINEITQILDQTREGMEKIKLDVDEERRARSKLKLKLRLRRQTLRTVQLTLRAVRIETDAYGASAAEALHHINRAERDNTTLTISKEDYYALTKRVEDEKSLAEWRVSVSQEQKLAAEASRNLTLTKLKEAQTVKISRQREIKEVKVIGDGHTIREAEEQDSNLGQEARVNSKRVPFPKARARAIAESDLGHPRQQLKRSKTGPNKNLAKTKKISFLRKIRHCLARNISRLFG